MNVVGLILIFISKTLSRCIFLYIPTFVYTLLFL